jgi:hypothetical protein
VDRSSSRICYCSSRRIVYACILVPSGWLLLILVLHCLVALIELIEHCEYQVMGYDAGYYGYLWSEVYAYDMFSKFSHQCIDQELGKQLRESVLGRGATTDGHSMLMAFLQREPSHDAFLKAMGIHNSNNGK